MASVNINDIWDNRHHVFINIQKIGGGLLLHVD